MLLTIRLLLAGPIETTIIGPVNDTAGLRHNKIYGEPHQPAGGAAVLCCVVNTSAPPLQPITLIEAIMLIIVSAFGNSSLKEISQKSQPAVGSVMGSLFSFFDCRTL